MWHGLWRLKHRAGLKSRRQRSSVVQAIAGWVGKLSQLDHRRCVNVVAWHLMWRFLASLREFCYSNPKNLVAANCCSLHVWCSSAIKHSLHFCATICVTRGPLFYILSLICSACERRHFPSFAVSFKVGRPLMDMHEYIRRPKRKSSEQSHSGLFKMNNHYILWFILFIFWGILRKTIQKRSEQTQKNTHNMRVAAMKHLWFDLMTI